MVTEEQIQQHYEKFMEYIKDYGTFSDVPILLMNEEMKKYYPHLFESSFDTKEFSFHHLDLNKEI